MPSIAGHFFIWSKNMFEYAIVFSISFIIGILTGDRIRAMRFSALPWVIMKWNDGSLGYRVVPRNTATVQRGEKAYLCIEVNTDHLEPGKKVKIFED